MKSYLAHLNYIYVFFFEKNDKFTVDDISCLGGVEVTLVISKCQT